MVLLVSCINPEKIYYMNNIQETSIRVDQANVDPKIQNGDQLYIYVSSLDLNATMIYNAPNFATPRQNGSTIGTDATALNGYLVDTNGDIVMPQIGTVHAAGLTFNELKADIELKLKDYLQDAIVSIRCLNYRISILGEVNRPGTYNIPYHEINVLQALGMAGDLTINGKRENIMIIRQDGDKRDVHRMNLTSRDLIKDPYYQLQSGDIIYVEPNKARLNTTSTFFQIWPTVASAVTLIILAVNLSN